MPYLEAVSPNLVVQSIVRVDDAVWTASAPEINAAAAQRGYSFNVYDTEEAGAIERNCESLGEVLNWISTLNPDED